MKKPLLALTLAIASGAYAEQHVSLQPDRWTEAKRKSLEALEYLSWAPVENVKVDSREGIVSATVSPIAVYAGCQALRMGGSAADAAATVALTQVATQLGSTVSYAGVFTMLYYDAEEGSVHSMDAGFNTYLHEADPLSILASDLGLLVEVEPSSGDDKYGRMTLVPGFMAGIEAMLERFGALPLSELLLPAIWYSEKGIKVSPALSSFFQMRRSSFERTPEGRRFLAQSGSDVPKIGDLFLQSDLALMLKAVAEEGAQFMYTGEWAKTFVDVVQREGGKATLEDLSRYRPIWTEPRSIDAFGHTIYVNGPPHYGAYGIAAGLHLAEALSLHDKGPYWNDLETLSDLTRITQFLVASPAISPSIAQQLHQFDIPASPEDQLGKDFAKAVAPVLEQLMPAAPKRSPRHSNAIVAIDKAGNIAVVTHTINAVVWGSSGIVVGGIPLPDSAGFQQQAIAALAPGSRLPHQIVDTIAFQGSQPVLATASIGASLMPETLRVLVGVLGQKLRLRQLMAAPPLLASFARPGPEGDQGLPVSVSNAGYHPQFLDALKKRFPRLELMDPQRVGALRGTVAAVAIDPKTGTRSAVDQAGVMVFNAVE